MTCKTFIAAGCGLAFLTACVLYVIYDVAQLQFLGRIFPLSVALITLAMLAAIAVLFRSGRANYGFHDNERGWPADEKPVRSDLYFQGWILALLGAIAVLGFVLGILAYISVFLRFNAGVRWIRAIAGGVAASAVLIALGDALVLHYPGGLVQSLFALPWPFD